MSIILASASPRRRELLEHFNIPGLAVVPARGEAPVPEGAAPADAVMAISRGKALDVAEQCAPGDVIIAADTVVALDGDILGKPRDAAEAAEMLRRLSGRAHEVLTGLCLLRGETVFTRVDGAKVFFDEMTEEEIAAYARTGEPLDKAGGYGIQGLGGQFVRRIEGDYYATVGLSLCGLRRLMQSAGIGKER